MEIPNWKIAENVQVVFAKSNRMIDRKFSAMRCKLVAKVFNWTLLLKGWQNCDVTNVYVCVCAWEMWNFRVKVENINRFTGLSNLLNYIVLWWNIKAFRFYMCSIYVWNAAVHTWNSEMLTSFAWMLSRLNYLPPFLLNYI